MQSHEFHSVNGSDPRNFSSSSPPALYFEVTLSSSGRSSTRLPHQLPLEKRENQERTRVGGGVGCLPASSPCYYPDNSTEPRKPSRRGEARGLSAPPRPQGEAKRKRDPRTRRRRPAFLWRARALLHSHVRVALEGAVDVLHHPLHQHGHLLRGLSHLRAAATVADDR